ncbi:MAG: cysteine desulfurase family protein [Pirellula sp.]
MAEEIYLDNHATTAVDPRVVEAMLPAMLSEYANAGSITHQPGRRAAQRIQEHKEQMLYLLGAQHAELIFTSGATESINLALFGIALHPRQKRRSVLVGTIDHKAVLDCARKLSKQGLNVQTIDLVENRSADLLPCVGIYDLEALGKQLNDDVAIVSLILGNNEIGSLQDMRPIADLCHQHGAMLHLDATQAIGKIPFDAQAVGADLVSFSAHKFYGPKGVGGLLICNDTIQLSPVIVGGGQQNNLRSGTLNTAGIVGMARALEISVAQLDAELPMVYSLRDRLWQKLKTRIDGLKLNGPDWKTLPPSDPTVLQRLPGNLNVRFPNVDGQSLMLKVPSLAVSSGSACTSAEPAPSHVLIGIGLSQDQARSSLRFGIGRFNTETQIDQAADRIVSAYAELLHFVA